MQKILSACLVFAAAAPGCARAESAADIAALRQEIAEIRSSHESRLRALEQRLNAAEAATATATAAAPVPVTAAAVTTTAAMPVPVATPAPFAVVPARAAAGANAFNPSISLILSGLYTHASQDPSRYAITGFPLPPGAAAGPGTQGLSLAETELGLSASIDPWLRGAVNISLHPDNTVSVEEAFVQTTALGNGLGLKAGRFFSGIGYLNPQHAHTWDFVDNPLAYQAMLGTQYGDDGVQLSWLAPTDLFIELGAELGRGANHPGSLPASGAGRNRAGMSALMLHAGGDVGESQTWRAGVSVLDTQASEQTLLGLSSAGAPVTSVFNGNTRVWVLDGVWKWAPGGNATRTSLKLQGEYLRSTRSGNLVVDPVPGSGAYRSAQSGWYVQGVYQFMPAWRVGLRSERLDPGTPDYSLGTGLIGTTAYKPSKHSLMIDFSASEFSRVRLQLARDLSRAGAPDNLVFLQYQMSLGAHGAHGY